MTKFSRVLISGAGGLIGSALVQSLSAEGISISRLTRGPAQGAQDISWNPHASPSIADRTLLEGFDAVVHLGGANLSSHRWTPAYKKEIVESRTRSTHALTHLLGELRQPPAVFLCASAVGIYGERGDEVLTEESSAGTGFLADTCLAWEAAAQPARDAGIRTVHMRFGVVLSPDGGALKKMLPLFRAGLGGRLGSGRQWMSWISLPDLVRAARYVMDTDDIHGPVNFVSPAPVTNREFTSALAQALRRPAILPAPAFALRLALGEMADEALLASTRVAPLRLADSGFPFEQPQLSHALDALLSA